MRRTVIVVAAAAACSAPSETAETVAAACDFSAPGSRDASWSPDGASLVFDTNRDGNQEIYVMGADGSNPRRLTETEDSEYYPFYSPDGSRLTFMTADAEGITRVSVMNADGSDLTHLTPAGVTNADPTWSPDGKPHRVLHRPARRRGRDLRHGRGRFELDAPDRHGRSQPNAVVFRPTGRASRSSPRATATPRSTS